MAQFDFRQSAKLEQKYDSGLQVRALGPWLVKFTFLFSVLFAAYHYVTAGIGVPVDYWHMGVHMSGVIILVFIGYPMLKKGRSAGLHTNTWWRFGNVPLWDWVLILAGVASSLYIGFTWYEINFEFMGEHFFLPEQVMRQGDPALI